MQCPFLCWGCYWTHREFIRILIDSEIWIFVLKIQIYQIMIWSVSFCHSSFFILHPLLRVNNRSLFLYSHLNFISWLSTCKDFSLTFRSRVNSFEFIHGLVAVSMLHLTLVICALISIFRLENRIELEIRTWKSERLLPAREMPVDGNWWSSLWNGVRWWSGCYVICVTFVLCMFSLSPFLFLIPTFLSRGGSLISPRKLSRSLHTWLYSPTNWNRLVSSIYRFRQSPSSGRVYG